MNNDNDTFSAQTPQDNEIIVYQPDEALKLDVRVENDTVWLTQDQMAELFQRDISAFSKLSVITGSELLAKL